jgi:predicted amidohydrolase YtcJ
VALLAVVVSAGCSSTRLFVNGDVLTMNPDRPWADAVAVRDGRILAVGTRVEVEREAGAGFEVEDLRGNTVVPGFIDAHGHVFLAAMRLASADLRPPPSGPVGSLGDLQSTLGRHVQNADLEPDDWIVGMGYDQTAIAERRHPTREDLDPMSGEHPTLLLHSSSQIAVLNSRALAEVGISEDTRDPDGGVIRRKPGSREPSGVLEGTAVRPALDVLSLRDGDETAREIEAVLDDYASQGITTMQEAAVPSPEVLDLFRALARKDRLRIDVVAYPVHSIADQTLVDFEADQRYRDHFRLGGISLVLDGSLQDRAGYLTEPYHRQPPPDAGGTSGGTGAAAPAVDGGYRGHPWFEKQQELDGWMGRAYEKGWPVLARASGDAAIDMLLSAARVAETAHPGRERRTVIVQAQTMRDDQLDEARKLGMVPSFLASDVYYRGDRHRDVLLGPERAARLDPLGSASDRGMRFTIHADAPAISPDMLHLVWTAANRRTSSGAELGGDQRIPVIEGLRAVTIDAAHQIFEEDTKGSIEPGKLADLVILSANPVELDPKLVKDIVVVETIKEGKTVYRRY